MIEAVNIGVPEIFLPIGISFFTFQAISYVIDIYRGHGEVQKNPVNVGLYISFFPQLIAGPIVRYETIAAQISVRTVNADKFTVGVKRFVIGLGKKMIIANSMAMVADTAFGTETSGLSVGMAWLGAIAYTMQIYYDFSGYSDMAIGLGKMFGFDFLENFNYPYISKSVSEFWRRWHISLGTWFRDYVYIPLGGSRVNTKARLLFNLFVVWFLTGLWHGANWTFIVWGLMYFVLISIEKLSGFEKAALPAFVKWIYTMSFVVIGWVIFRSVDIFQSIEYFSAMLGLYGNALIDSQLWISLGENMVIFIFAFIFSAPFVPWLNHQLNKRIPGYKPVIVQISYFVVFILSSFYVIKGGYNPFIYFNF
jgi:alginate O-acetyltransferase complex protein AlgI